MSDPIRFPRRVQEHIDEAYANYCRYQRMMEKPEDISWGIVFLFYSALHLLQAYARHYTPNDIPKDHEDRQNYVAYYMPEEFAVQYERLYQASRQARYYLAKFSPEQIRRIHDDHFAQIRKYLRQQGIKWQIPNR